MATANHTAQQPPHPHPTTTTIQQQHANANANANSNINSMTINPPSGDTLILLAALSNPAAVSHVNHTEALAARDRALAASATSYGHVCTDFARTLATADPSTIPEPETAKLAHANPTAAAQLSHDPTSWVHLRQMAGLLLKNAMASPPPANAIAAGPDPDPANANQLQVDGLGRPAGGYMRLPSECALEIKAILLKCVSDSHSSVRRVASSTISGAAVSPVALASAAAPGRTPSLPLAEWPELTPFLLGCVESGLVGAPSTGSGGTGTGTGTGTGAAAAAAAHALEGSLLTLRKLLEDNPLQFESESGPAFNANLVPLLLRAFRCEGGERIRREGLRCAIGLIPTMPGCLVARIDDFLGGLSALATDDSVEVRRLVCQAIVAMLSLRTEYLQPHFGPICDFILNATSDADQDVALEASEFWLTFASLDESAVTSDMVQHVRTQTLPRLVPVLIRGMVYTEEKREELLDANALDESNAAAADRLQDVKPIFHSSHAKRGEDDDDDNASDEDDDDDDDDDNEWNVRKCSAASLDSLAGMFGPEDVLPPLLPALQEGLSHSDPWVREASVLALGAVADGCSEAMAQHMAQLHPYLMTQLTDPTSLPQLKSIAAWTLGRYASWAVDQAHSVTGQPDLIARMTEALMGRILDPNKKVQVAVCSAFGVLVESAVDLLVPYLEPVYRTLVQALGVYQTRSLVTLFDILGTMADYLGPVIGEGTLPSIFIPPLLQIWNGLARHNPMDRTLLPLIESLASIALVTGSNFQPWALETFEGGMSTIETCVMMLSTLEDDYADEDADPIICSADLIDGLVEGFGPNFASLISGSTRYKDQFLTVLHSLTAHDVAGVRMSAFALLGDLARHAPSVIQPGMNELMTEAISSMEPMHPSVCNNAVWAIGEISVKCEGNPPSLQPYAGDILQNLISLLMGSAVNDEGESFTVPGLQENAAATMGRLAKVSPAFVAADLPRFLTGWCEGMAKISDPSERRDAFQGFILSLHANPQALHTATNNICETISSILFAVVSWHIPDTKAVPTADGEIGFVPFPPENAEVGAAIKKLLQEVKASVGQETWAQVEKQMPVNVRRLLREAYDLSVS